MTDDVWCGRTETQLLAGPCSKSEECNPIIPIMLRSLFQSDRKNNSEQHMLCHLNSSCTKCPTDSAFKADVLSSNESMRSPRSMTFPKLLRIMSVTSWAQWRSPSAPERPCGTKSFVVSRGLPLAEGCASKPSGNWWQNSRNMSICWKNMLAFSAIAGFWPTWVWTNRAIALFQNIWCFQRRLLDPPYPSLELPRGPSPLVGLDPRRQSYIS